MKEMILLVGAKRGQQTTKRGQPREGRRTEENGAKYPGKPNGARGENEEEAKNKHNRDGGNTQKRGEEKERERRGREERQMAAPPIWTRVKR